MRRIILYGLRLEFKGFILAIQSWQIKSSLVELENLLIDQENMMNQMVRISLKSENEEAFFSDNKIR